MRENITQFQTLFKVFVVVVAVNKWKLILKSSIVGCENRNGNNYSERKFWWSKSRINVLSFITLLSAIRIAEIIRGLLRAGTFIAAFTYI